jgi:hypothetical protein
MRRLIAIALVALSGAAYGQTFHDAAGGSPVTPAPFPTRNSAGRS